MSKAYSVKNYKGTIKHFIAKDEQHAVEMAIQLKMAKKEGRLKISEYPLDKHNVMEKNYIMLLECRKSFGELIKESNFIKINTHERNIIDFDGCFKVLSI